MSNTAYKEYISKLETLFDTVVKSSANGYYEGERNSAGQPHGFGTMHYPESNDQGRKKYEGEWQDGKKHGKGKLIWTTGESYDGDWQDDKIQGWGKFIYSDGSFYDGEWKNGIKQGKGKYIRPNGSSYDGDWEDGKKNGWGTMNYSINDEYDRVQYNGNWENGKIHGWGSMNYSTGDYYSGLWENNSKIGFSDFEITIEKRKQEKKRKMFVKYRKLGGSWDDSW